MTWFGELAAIGSSETGWNRLAWSPLEAEARAWFTRTAESIGLRVEKDGAGTLWAVTDDADSGPWVCAGSHLDTQPDGGAYDGALGVVSALVAAAALLEAGSARHHPLAVVAFVDEEGARFRTPTFASLAITGGLNVDHVLEVMGDAPAIYDVTRESLLASRSQLDRVRCFLEVHVEQGRSLIDRGLALGIADVLAPRQRWRVEFEGEANHAGTTAMADRRDALLPGGEVRAGGRGGGTRPARRGRHRGQGRDQSRLDELDPRPRRRIAGRAGARAGDGRGDGRRAARPLRGGHLRP